MVNPCVTGVAEGKIARTIIGVVYSEKSPRITRINADISVSSAKISVNPRTFTIPIGGLP
ncbi:MAG: hypothetical protein LBJ41_06640 [Treponema sp.]|nr:hypothetical protein [Treponema sp.]